MRKKARLQSILLLLSFSLETAAKISFDGITCQSDVRKELLGRHMLNEKVMVTERKYKDIGLKGLGGFGLQEDPYFVIWWEVCGREYVLLETQNIVRDVLASPLTDSAYSFQIATCTSDDKELEEVVITYSVKPTPRGIYRPEFAWGINEKTLKFFKITKGEVVCKQ